MLNSFGHHIELYRNPEIEDPELDSGHGSEGGQTGSSQIVHSISTMDVFFHRLQSSPQMGFFVGFDGVKRVQLML
jgi:hypothetical protein